MKYPEKLNSNIISIWKLYIFLYVWVIQKYRHIKVLICCLYSHGHMIIFICYKLVFSVFSVVSSWLIWFSLFFGFGWNISDTFNGLWKLQSSLLFELSLIFTAFGEDLNFNKNPSVFLVIVNLLIQHLNDLHFLSFWESLCFWVSRKNPSCSPFLNVFNNSKGHYTCQHVSIKIFSRILNYVYCHLSVLEIFPKSAKCVGGFIFFVTTSKIIFDKVETWDSKKCALKSWITGNFHC